MKRFINIDDEQIEIERNTKEFKSFPLPRNNLQGDLKSDILRTEYDFITTQQSISDEVTQYQSFFRLFSKQFLEKSPFYLDGNEVHPVPNKKDDTDVVEVSKGGSKKAVSFGDLVCLIPNTDVDKLNPSQWKRIISEEKRASDEVATIGLKTQDFKLSKLEVKDPDDGKYYAIDVLSTKNFYNLAEEKNISVIDRKNSIPFGKKISYFNHNKMNMENANWNKEMLQSLMNEIVLALSYGAPCTCDSQNYFISHSVDSDSPPTAHLFLYDFTIKEKNLHFPLIRGIPVIPIKEEVLKNFRWALKDIFYFASDEEHSSLGCSLHLSFSELSDKQTNAILDNEQLINDMLEMAFDQDQLKQRKMTETVHDATHGVKTNKVYLPLKYKNDNKIEEGFIIKLNFVLDDDEESFIIINGGPVNNSL